MPEASTLIRPYCTIEEVRRETRNKDGHLDNWYRTCVNRASRVVDEETQRDFWFHDHSSSALTIKRKWIADDTIYLPWPVLTLTEIAYDGEIRDPESYEADGGMILTRCAWSRPAIGKALTIKGTFGYTLHDDDQGEQEPPEDIPAKIRRATTLIASAISMEMARELIDPTGSKQSILDSRIPQEAKMLLMQFRWRFF